jgi:hypothetical protein
MSDAERDSEPATVRSPALCRKSPGGQVMEEAYAAINRDACVAETPTVSDQEVLDRAIVKLVLLGRRVGVDPDRMIELLDSGLSVGELLIYLAVCNDRHV